MIDALALYLMDTSGLARLVLIFLKSTAVLALGLMVWMTMRQASASARHVILCITLFAAAMVPVAALLMPPLPLPIVSLEMTSAAPSFEADSPSADGSAAAAVASASVKRHSVSGAQPAAPLSLESGVLIFAASLSLAMLIRLGLGVARLYRISRRATQIQPDSNWYSLLPAALKTRTRILLTEEITTPLTWGLSRPVIVLPSTALQWRQQDLRHALMHEASHIERHDWLCQIGSRLICALYWYNPLIWFVHRQLILEAERAADDRVLLAGNAACDYAQQLIALTTLSSHRHLVPLPANTMAAKNLLPLRVRSILNNGIHRMPLPNTRKFVALVFITGFSLVVGSAQLSASPQQITPERPAIDSDHSTTPLIHAAAVGDHAEVMRLLGAGHDVNELSLRRTTSKWHQRSALTTAAKSGHADIVATLLDAGAPVDRVVKGDATALIEALKENHADVAKLLIARGADASLTVRGDGSPLIAAARAGNLDMVNLLLDRSADPNDWVRGDGSALHQAAKGGHVNIVERLITAGADVNQKLPGDGNALTIAANRGHKEIVRILMAAGARADSGVRGDGNAMIMAAKKGDVDLLTMMIATGADVNAAVRGDANPLIEAARHGHMDAVKLLLENGAEIDKVVPGDENALIGAAWAGHLSMVEYLLAQGADPNIQTRIENGKYRTALSQAKVGGHRDVVQVLEAAGAKK